MAILAVINSTTNQLVGTIVAELNDYCPEGCYFVELPPNHKWVNGEIFDAMATLPITQLQVF